MSSPLVQLNSYSTSRTTSRHSSELSSVRETCSAIQNLGGPQPVVCGPPRFEFIESRAMDLAASNLPTSVKGRFPGDLNLCPSMRNRQIASLEDQTINSR
jgi:hypothetical protein